MVNVNNMYQHDNNIMKDKLMTIKQTLVRDSQKCITGYSNMIMYMISNIKEQRNQIAHASTERYVR